jgi:hypothetical protein
MTVERMITASVVAAPFQLLGILTLSAGFKHRSWRRGLATAPISFFGVVLPLYPPAWLPLYPFVWFLLLARRLSRTVHLRIGYHLGSIGGSLVFWSASLLWSQRIYLGLAD